MPMSLKQAETSAIGVGVLTVVIGAALTGAPGASARAVGVPADGDVRVGMRAIGVVDLVIACGLLAGAPRWPWLVARAAANPPTAAYLGWLGRRHRARALTPIAGIIGAATVGDALACRTLRAAGR